MARDDPYFRLRIPEALKAQIEEAAALNNRSATAEILHRLERSFEIEGEWEKMVENVAALMENMSDVLGRMQRLEEEVASVGEAAGVRDPSRWKD